MAASKVGHGLAKGLGINVHPVKEPPVAVPDEYIEVEPTVGGFFRNHTPTAHGVRAYIKSLFPFWNWIFHYNFTWLFGDIIAGRLPPVRSVSRTWQVG